MKSLVCLIEIFIAFLAISNFQSLLGVRFGGNPVLKSFARISEYRFLHAQK